jgi:hypothetical protein
MSVIYNTEESLIEFYSRPGSLDGAKIAIVLEELESVFLCSLPSSSLHVFYSSFHHFPLLILLVQTFIPIYSSFIVFMCFAIFLSLFF